MNQFNVPSKILFGGGHVDEVMSLIHKHSSKVILLVTDDTIRKLNLIKSLISALEERNSEIHIFDEITPNPSDVLIDECYKQFKDQKIDMIIAFGGGSVIDAAKAINILLTNGGTISNYFEVGNIKRRTLPLIAIPTTSGTASEVTGVSVITDTLNKKKVVIMGDSVSADYAVLDYTLTYGLPASITASTGMDALTHAIEAYVSTLSTPFTDANAKAAMELIIKNLPLAVKNGENKLARKEMMIGSTMAGLAFNSAILGLVHAIAHPLGAHFNVPHGVANAIMLPYVMEYNGGHCGHKLIEIGKCLGIAAEYISPREIRNALLKMNDQFNIPKLSDTGINPKDFDRIADAVMKEASIHMNPRVVERGGVIDVLKVAYYA